MIKLCQPSAAHPLLMTTFLHMGNFKINRQAILTASKYSTAGEWEIPETSCALSELLLVRMCCVYYGVQILATSPSRNVKVAISIRLLI